MLDYFKLMFLVFFLLLIFLLQFFRKKYAKFDFFDIFNFYFILMYLFPIFLWIAFPSVEVWGKYRFGIEVGAAWDVIFTIFFAYFLVYLGFRLGMRSRATKLYSFGIASTPRLLYLHLLSFFFIICFFWALYNAGGIHGYIAKGILARSFEESMGLAGYLTVMLNGIEYFAYLWLALGIFFKKKIYYFYFVIFFVISYVISLSSGSREALIYPILFLIFFVYGAFGGSLKLYFSALLVLFFAVFVISESRHFFYEYSRGAALDWGEDFDPLLGILGLFAYYEHYLITVGEAIYNIGVYEGPRLWIDYFRVFLDATPGISWASGDLDVFGYTKIIAEINRIYLGGIGYVPPGWIGASIINGWIFGLVVQSLIAGWFGGVLNSIFLKHRHGSAWVLQFLLAYMFMNFWYRIFFAQDPWQILIPNFGMALIVFSALMALVEKNKNTSLTLD